jgi:hypothetical protein
MTLIILAGGVGLLMVIVIALIAVVHSRSAKAYLPHAPNLGAQPAADLRKYYDLQEPALAWEKVRAWELNQTPPALDAPGSIDHLVLTPSLLEFCSGRTGKLELVFNFLVAAIQHIEFDPHALVRGSAPVGHGLLTIYTPSGCTYAITSGPFAQALHEAMTRARELGAA